MDEELEQFCSNCRKNVGTANFATHSAFCQRHIKICEVCDNPMPKISIKEHEEEYHIFVKCEKCNASVKKWKMPQHLKVCPKRLVTCEFCEADFFANEVEDHIEFCGSRTELCERCTKYIMLRDKKEHLEEVCPKRQVTCKFCEAVFFADEVEDNIEFCESRTELCKCCTHLNIIIKQNQKLLECPRFEDFYTEYGAGKIFGNTRNEFLSKTSEKEMAACGSQSSQAIYNELTEDDQATFCPFCKKVLHFDVIHEHIDSCSEKYFQCDLCFEGVLWEDRYKHTTFQCNMIQDRMPSNLYECPLCGKQMLEKDKSAHESQACPILLQDDGPLYSLGKGKTSKNYAEETKKNSTEAYMNSKEKIPVNYLRNKEQSHNTRKICAYCDKDLHEDTAEALHLRICEVYKQFNFDFSQLTPQTHHASTSVDRLRCIICLYKERDIVFQPCGHLIVCNNCAENIESTCPMCRRHVTTKIRAYIN